MKLFRAEIQRFYQKLISGSPFAFSKYADGEWMAMNQIAGEPGNGEWHIGADTERSVDLLIKSFQYQDPGYYVGISCPCCQGINHDRMKTFSGQTDEQLTFANLFVNANYQYYLDNFIPEFARRRIILVANGQSDLTRLPFAVEEFWGIGYDAWVRDLWILEQIPRRNYQDCIVLFSCGPLGNILAHQLWANNKNNVYMDVGSTLDRWLSNDQKNKRRYALGDPAYSDQVCVWGSQ